VKNKRTAPTRAAATKALWLGETLRLRLSVASWRHGDSHVDVQIVRDYLLSTSADEIAKRYLVPSLIALKQHIAKQAP